MWTQAQPGRKVREWQEQRWVRHPLALRSADRLFPRPPSHHHHPAPGEMTYPCDNLTGLCQHRGKAAGRTSEFRNVQVPTQSSAEQWRGRRCPGLQVLDGQPGGSCCRRQGAGGGWLSRRRRWGGGGVLQGPPASQCHLALPRGCSRMPLTPEWKVASLLLSELRDVF